jgi:hypothetical protein
LWTKPFRKNSSKPPTSRGFPFQIGVRNEIERTISEHGWDIVAEEYPWTHLIGGKSGFIDLLAEHKLSVNSSSLASALKQLELREEGKRSLWNAYERLVPATAVD